MDDYDDALTADESADGARTPPIPLKVLEAVREHAPQGGIIDLVSSKLAISTLARAESTSTISSNLPQQEFESHHGSPELFHASQDLTASRSNSDKLKDRYTRLVKYVNELGPFDLKTMERDNKRPSAQEELDMIKRIKSDGNDAEMQLLEQVEELRTKLEQGKERYERMLSEFDAISKDRQSKDKRYTEKVAKAFSIPEESVDGIIQACSE